MSLMSLYILLICNKSSNSNEYLDKVNVWMNSNKLVLNSKKNTCYFMPFIVLQCVNKDIIIIIIIVIDRNKDFDLI